MENKERKMKILHKPLGNEQPYFQKAYERFPRYPLSGEPFTVGCVVEDVPAEVVVVEYSFDSWDSYSSLQALCVGNTDSVGHAGHEYFWLATIPGSDETLVSYRFRAYSGFSEEISACFSLRPAERIVCDSCLLTEDGRVFWYSSLTAAAVCMHVTPGRTMDITIDTDFRYEGMGVVACTVGDLSISIDDDVLAIADTAADKLLLECCNCFLTERYDSDEHIVELSIVCEESERFYGFGERYNGLNQRGQIIQNRVFEQYKNQQLKSYMPVPFFFTSLGRGLYSATDHRMDYDLCATESHNVIIRWYLGAEDMVRNHLYSGSPLEMIHKYSSDTSLPAMPPEWVFGPWMSSNEWNTQERVLAEARMSAKLDIPATVLVIEAWSDETTFYIWNGAEYDSRDPSEGLSLKDFSFTSSSYWSDPKAMSDELHELGMKLVLWQIPVIKASAVDNGQHKLDWEHAEKMNYIVREADGSSHHSRPGWFQGSLLPDFTNPAAADWWFGKREYLVRECGVDGFKTDGGEQLWGEKTLFSNGKRGSEMLNRFPVEYLKSYHSFLDRELGGEGVTFSRSGYRGIQSYPVHWAGDQGSTWEAYRGVLPAALNSGLSGIPFVGWDIGGFSGEIPTAELYLRSAATAVFSSIMQYHSEYHEHVEPHVDRTPWNIAERNGMPEVVAIYRMFAKLRMAMLDYIVEEAKHCCISGEPLMRPLLLDYADDSAAWEIEDQYLFGRALLVAPLLFPGMREREVYLPADEWTDVWSGEKFSGRCRITVSAELDTIPVFRNSSAVWPLDNDLFMHIVREYGRGGA